MAGSVNKVIDLYRAGRSIPEVAELTGVSRSTVRYHVAKAGALRSRAEGVRLSAPKISAAHKGRKRAFSNSHCQAISEARNRWAEGNSAGVSEKSSGYIEYTRGPNKGRSVHVVKMEERLGRRILPDEVVHHIDGDRSNNDINNLALMTRVAHSRLHRREDELSGTPKERNARGRFC